jgi:hypothetical protein
MWLRELAEGWTRLRESTEGWVLRRQIQSFERTGWRGLKWGAGESKKGGELIRLSRRSGFNAVLSLQPITPNVVVRA